LKKINYDAVETSSKTLKVSQKSSTQSTSDSRWNLAPKTLVLSKYAFAASTVEYLMLQKIFLVASGCGMHCKHLSLLHVKWTSVN